MTKPTTSDYQEVDRRFDYCIQGVDVWIYYGNNTEHKDGERHIGDIASKIENGKEYILSFIHSELDRVREETIKECVEALPKKKDGYDFRIDFPNSKFNKYEITNYLNGFNEAIDTVTTIIKALLPTPTSKEK